MTFQLPPLPFAKDSLDPHMSAETLESLPQLKRYGTMLEPTPGFRTWTDDFSNMFSILKH